MSYHAARALLADEASSSAAGMGLVNVSIEESYQVNEDAFHDRIIKVRIPRPAQRLRLRSHARLSADGFIFPARRGPLDRRIAQRTTWQNGSTAGSRRPKRRWEAATHRNRVPPLRKAAAERQPSPPEIVSSSPPEGKAAHQEDAARRGRPHRARACYWYIDHTRWLTLPSQWKRIYVRRGRQYNSLQF